MDLLSSSPARWKILQEAADILWHSMSRTLWSARTEAVKPPVKRAREILQVLVKLKEEVDFLADLCNEVDCLSKWLTSFRFILLASVWFKTLQAIENVRRLLQSSQITLNEESK